jgi:methyl-accepting chemotaxis protein
MPRGMPQRDPHQQDQRPPSALHERPLAAEALPLLCTLSLLLVSGFGVLGVFSGVQQGSLHMGAAVLTGGGLAVGLAGVAWLRRAQYRAAGAACLGGIGVAAVLAATLFGPGAPAALVLVVLVGAASLLMVPGAVSVTAVGALVLYLALRAALPGASVTSEVSGGVLPSASATAGTILAMTAAVVIGIAGARRRLALTSERACLEAELRALQAKLARCNATVDHAVHQLERARDLRRLVGEQVLSLATSLAATARTQASAIAEQATAVSEVAMTMEELARTAGEIVQSTHETLAASEEGAGVVAAAVSGIEAIRTQVHDVAQRIVTLGTQSQNIGEIVEILNDIANKIHLLSLNAAIEACAAGEHGRRFSVVAQQVKELARDAKRSTEQVKGLILQTQTATAAAVAATEEATREAERGVKLVHQASDVITRVVQRAHTLTAVTHQQHAASEQVAHTLRGIEEVVRQSALSAGEIARTADELSSAAGQLQQDDGTAVSTDTLMPGAEPAGLATSPVGVS